MPRQIRAGRTPWKARRAATRISTTATFGSRRKNHGVIHERVPLISNRNSNSAPSPSWSKLTLGKTMPASSFRRLITASAVPALGAFALVALSASPSTAASIATWDKVAQCESTGNWSINSGNGYYGGLQFSMSTWREFGGAQYAARADLATKKQQILIGEKVLARQTERAWPTCGPAAGLGRDHADPYPAEPPVVPGMAELATGDFNGDGNSDIAAVPTSGNLSVYPGNGVGSFDAPSAAGTGWNTVGNLVGGDFNGDGKADLAAVEKSTGNLFIYTGNGNGTFGTRIFSGTGWNNLDHLSAGDFDSDGKSDIAAVGRGDGNLYIYPGNGVGSFGTPIFAGTGWNNLDQLTGGDFNGDGKSDIAAVGKGDGVMYIYPGNGAGAFDAAASAGTGWNTMRDIVGGDFNRDGRSDLDAVQAAPGSTGTMYFYPGTGQNTFGNRLDIGFGW
ncbi:FG-GAP-like repeat-containing protein [Embleya sp. NPDC001921]